MTNKPTDIHWCNVEDNIHCPYCKDKNVKNNGNGYFRCRNCDTEFKLTHYQGNCDHTWKYFRRCQDCGKEQEKVDGTWIDSINPVKQIFTDN